MHRHRPISNATARAPRKCLHGYGPVNMGCVFRVKPPGQAPRRWKSCNLSFAYCGVLLSCRVFGFHVSIEVLHNLCKILHKLCNFSYPTVEGSTSYVSQACVNFLNSGLTVYFKKDDILNHIFWICKCKKMALQFCRHSSSWPIYQKAAKHACKMIYW